MSRDSDLETALALTSVTASLYKTVLKYLYTVLAAIFLLVLWSQTKVLTKRGWVVVWWIIAFIFVQFLGLTYLAQPGQDNGTGAFVLIILLVVDVMLAFLFYRKLSWLSCWEQRKSIGAAAWSLEEEVWRLSLVEAHRMSEIAEYTGYAADTGAQRMKEVEDYCAANGITKEQLGLYAEPGVAARYQLLGTLLESPANHVGELMANYDRLADEYHDRGIYVNTGEVYDILERDFTLGFTRQPVELHWTRYLAFIFPILAIPAGISLLVDGFAHKDFFIKFLGLLCFCYSAFVTYRYHRYTNYINNFVFNYFNSERIQAREHHKAEYSKLLRELVRKHRQGQLPGTQPVNPNRPSY